LEDLRTKKHPFHFYLEQIDNAKRSELMEDPFEALELYGEPEVIEALIKYVEEARKGHCVHHIYNGHGYSSQHFLAIRTLGYVGNSSESELIVAELSSPFEDMRYIALSSLCEMYKRNVLSKTTREFAHTKFVSILVDESSANEDVIECVSALANAKDVPASHAVDYALSSRLEIQHELREMLDLPNEKVNNALFGRLTSLLRSFLDR